MHRSYIREGIEGGKLLPLLLSLPLYMSSALSDGIRFLIKGCPIFRYSMCEKIRVFSSILSQNRGTADSIII